MPGARAKVATGFAERAGVPHHGLLGLDGTLRGRALALRLVVEDAEGRLRVRAQVENRGAGHAVPTGLPERRVVLRLVVRDARGGEVARHERAFGRRLVDAAGAPAPFFAAARVAADDRIPPRAERVEAALLDAPVAGGELVAALVWQDVAPAQAAALGLETREVTLVERRVPFGPARRRGRALLPRTVGFERARP
jgi:hypothetical protein